MSATTELMDKAKAELGLTSDYALAKALETSPARLSQWRKDVCECDTDMAVRLAEFAKLQVEVVLVAMLAEKVTSRTAKLALRKAAERLAA